MRLFHRTSPAAAEKILTEGFSDQTRNTYGIDIPMTGIWLSDVPVDSQDGATEGALLAIEIEAEEGLAEFEIIEDGRTYREWHMPAALITAKAVVRRATQDEEDAGDAERMARGLRMLGELPPESLGQ